MIATEVPGSDGMLRSIVTPCWQSKTPFVWKIPGARLSTPQFGAILIRYHKGELYHRAKVWTIEPSRVEA